MGDEATNVHWGGGGYTMLSLLLSSKQSPSPLHTHIHTPFFSSFFSDGWRRPEQI